MLFRVLIGGETILKLEFYAVTFPLSQGQCFIPRVCIFVQHSSLGFFANAFKASLTLGPAEITQDIELNYSQTVLLDCCICGTDLFRVPDYIYFCWVCFDLAYDFGLNTFEIRS